MKGTVEQCTQSKSGKSWRIKIGDKWFGAGFDSKLDSAVGKPIDFAFTTDAKFGDWIQSWVFDSGAPAPVPVPHAAPAKEERWWLPFVSNQCAHAIAAGKIQGVADLRSWAAAAKSAILAADSNDDIPF